VDCVDHIRDLLSGSGHYVFHIRVVLKAEELRAEATRKPVLRSLAQCYGFVKSLGEVDVTARASKFIIALDIFALVIHGNFA
jgi:hypothetical protein